MASQLQRTPLSQFLDPPLGCEGLMLIAMTIVNRCTICRKHKELRKDREAAGHTYLKITQWHRKGGARGAGAPPHPPNLFHVGT